MRVVGLVVISALLLTLAGCTGTRLFGGDGVGGPCLEEHDATAARLRQNEMVTDVIPPGAVPGEVWVIKPCDDEGYFGGVEIRMSGADGGMPRTRAFYRAEAAKRGWEPKDGRGDGLCFEHPDEPDVLLLVNSVSDDTFSVMLAFGPRPWTCAT
ncbi:hypothetical protein V5P93_006286 [Actinokineospora auranticolor]|uniref:Uncharacterized protein n=1 Tax=Actinokineospora auranticolor TaxID=155976 RepID=A0A2S6GI68_9PSEU|nr:hypothetical protein [Actinokineospora auranticolor]PPK64883.1 hypothetical protein CLV40_117122 [Actinokineospora auranticolor]